jgi:hypothetical protein
MKTRNGFVSNSSSSSFIVLGVKTEDEKIYEQAEKLKISNVTDDNSYYIGEVIADFSDEESLENQTIQILSSIRRVAKKIEQLGFSENDIQLHIGTRSC